MKNTIGKLGLSVVIDAIGFAPAMVSCTLIPFTGGSSLALIETVDIIWAPISAYLVHKLYNNGVLASIAFVEELLPCTDIVPTATIGWFVERYS